MPGGCGGGEDGCRRVQTGAEGCSGVQRGAEGIGGCGGVRRGADLALGIVREGLDELDEAEAAVDHDVPLLLEHGRLSGSKWVVSVR